MKKMVVVLAVIGAMTAAALSVPTFAQAQTKTLWQGWMEDVRAAFGPKAPPAPAKKDAKKKKK